MAADVLKYSIGNASSTTLSSSITGSDTSAPLTSDTNFAAKSGEGMALIDEGLASEEIAYATGKSGASLTIPLANRGLEGGSAQAHSSGASVKGILTAGMWNDLIDALSLIVDKTTGLVKAGIAFTSPKVITGINDTNNNELIKVTATASAVNEFTVANAATGNSPTISATGGDTDIDFQLTGKGSGKVKVYNGSSYVDPLVETNMTFTDVTTNDVSTTKHGFTPKAPNDTTKFLRGDATWAVPGSSSFGPAFLANKNGTDQSFTASTWTKATFGTEVFDTNNNFASSTFTPTTAGKYFATFKWRPTTAADGKIAYAAIYKNGSNIAYSELQMAGTNPNTVMVSMAVDMNGSTDYLDAYVWYDQTTPSIDGPVEYTYFTAHQIA